MYILIIIDYMRRYGLDVANGATFRASQIAVAHQCHVIAVDTDDAMHHISVTIYPCQYYMPHLRCNRLLQNDALLAADDKRQHAVAIDGKRHAYPLIHQPYGFLYDLVVIHRVMVSLHSLAAPSSGRHSRCHIGTVVASAFSVWCSPSAIRLSHRMPLILGTSAA